MKKIEPINKGWSNDRKFLVYTKEGKRLLRLSPADSFEKKQREYEKLKLIETSGILMSKSCDFGLCNKSQNVYMLLYWIEGEDLETVLPNLNNSDQYRLGEKAGKILKKIHSLPPKPEMAGDIVKKKLKQLDEYKKSDVRLKNDEDIIAFINENINILNSGRMAVCHGDFHPGNIIYTPDGRLGLIDFNRTRFAGDPYEEFYKLQHFGRAVSPSYANGQINSYFEGNIPKIFWQTLAVYVAHTALWSLKWAEPFGKTEIEHMKALALTALDDYDRFKRIIPKWYYKTYGGKKWQDE